MFEIFQDTQDIAEGNGSAGHLQKVVYCRRRGVILISAVYFYLLNCNTRKYFIHVFQYSRSVTTKNTMLASVQLLRSRSDPNVFDTTVRNLRVWLQHLNLVATLVDTAGRQGDWHMRVLHKFLLFIHLAFEMREEFGPI